LTLKLDLDSVKVNEHAKYLCQRSFCSKAAVWTRTRIWSDCCCCCCCCRMVNIPPTPFHHRRHHHNYHHDHHLRFMLCLLQSEHRCNCCITAVHKTFLKTKSQDVKLKIKVTRHRANTSMYSLTFCVRFLLPERYQWKPAVQTAAVMLRTPVCGARFWGHPPSPVGRRPAARADPAQPAVRTMTSYRGIDASL